MMPQVPSSRFVAKVHPSVCILYIYISHAHIHVHILHLCNALTHQARCDVELMSPEADYTEHYDTGEYGSQGISETDDEGVD